MSKMDSHFISFKNTGPTLALSPPANQHLRSSITKNPPSQTRSNLIPSHHHFNFLPHNGLSTLPSHPRPQLSSINHSHPPLNLLIHYHHHQLNTQNPPNINDDRPPRHSPGSPTSQLPPPPPTPLERRQTVLPGQSGQLLPPHRNPARNVRSPRAILPTTIHNLLSL